MKRLILHDLPPSVNHMYVNYRSKTGRRMRVLTTEAKKWFDDTVILTTVWKNRNKWETAKGKVIIRLWFYFPKGNHIDTHNGLKGLLDAFEDALIYENDRNALPQIIDFQIDRKNPRLEVEFEKVEENDGIDNRTDTRRTRPSKQTASSKV